MFNLCVFLCAVGLSAAAPGYGVVPGTSVSQYSTSVVLPGAGSLVLPAAAVPVLAQPPHSPAVLLDPVHGVPLDTPEVVAARAAHYQVKALSPYHHLRKRSAPLAYSSLAYSAPVAPVVSAYSAPVAYSSPVVSAYSSPVISAYSPAVVSHGTPVVSAYSAPVVSSPLAYSAVVPKALSVHPW